MVPELRERYLAKVDAELLTMLQQQESTPTERFWEVEERIRKEAKILRNCLDGHSRSKQVMFMAVMYGHGMLVDDDLESFSDELAERIRPAP